MKKTSILFALPFVLLLASFSMGASAETGNDCTRRGNTPDLWYGTLTNALDVPVVLVIPRNEWQCADWLGVYTPGQLDWLRLEPGASHKFLMWLAPKGPVNSSVSLFTMQVRFITQVGGGFNWHNERVGLNAFQGTPYSTGTPAYIYVYNPNRWIYIDESPTNQGSIPLANGKTATISYATMNVDVPGKVNKEAGGTITFRYR
mgnify:FL=1